MVSVFFVLIYLSYGVPWSQIKRGCEFQHNVIFAT